MENELLIILIIIFIYIFIHLNKNNLVYVESQTGTKFLVNNEPDKQLKSDIISKVVENMYKLKNHLVKNIEEFQDMEPYIKQLDENFNESRTTIYETDPTTEYTSYSVNKGEELSICLKSKKMVKYIILIY
jgi:translation elongation factor EF-Ts